MAFLYKLLCCGLYWNFWGYFCDCCFWPASSSHLKKSSGKKSNLILNKTVHYFCLFVDFTSTSVVHFCILFLWPFSVYFVEIFMSYVFSKWKTFFGDLLYSRVSHRTYESLIIYSFCLSGEYICCIFVYGNI